MHLPLHALLAMSTLLPASLVLAVNRPAVAQLPTTSDLTVEVTGLKNTDGQVCINVFAGSAGFLTEEGTLMQQCVLATESLAAAEISMDSSEDSSEEPSAEIPATPQPLSVTFEGLEPGTYAVSVLHDENGDNQLDTGMFGIPAEGFGFSGNPAIQMRAPEFSEAAVVVFGNKTTTEIDLIYY